MNPTVSQFNQKAEKTLNNLTEELKSIRTGKASSAMVENLVVETYGGSTQLRLQELASITQEGPMALSITPYDPSVCQDIEKALLKSPLGINPAVQGTKIFLKFPALSTEQREKFAKLVSQTVEERKLSIRNFRDDGRKQVKISFEKKEITEDDKYRIEKELDLASKKIMESVENIKTKKEKEIMEI